MRWIISGVMTTKDTNNRTGMPCARCSEPAVKTFKPFCSKRCADVDLGQWFTEGYSIPAVEPPDDWSEQSDRMERSSQDTPWNH